MKKILVCIALLASINANAQNEFRKGNWIIGAQSTNLDLKTGFDKWTSDIEFDFSAVGGYFLSDKFAVDVMAGVDYAKSGKKTEVDYVWSCAVNFGAGVRYYPIANLFVRLGYNGEVWNDSNLYSYLDAKVGYDIFLSKTVFFEPAVYYERKISSTYWQGVDRYNSLGLSLGIGVRF